MSSGHRNLETSTVALGSTEGLDAESRNRAFHLELQWWVATARQAASVPAENFKSFAGEGCRGDASYRLKLCGALLI